jgi:hypothetical protein
MQLREPERPRPRSELEALLGRADAPALDFLADGLTFEREIRPREAPPPGGAQVADVVTETEG